MSIGSMGGASGSGAGLAGQRPSIVAGLDVGTSKICCLIAEAGRARLDPTGQVAVPEIRVIGAAYNAAAGLRGGAIVDLGAAEHAIRAAVDGAERMAGIELDRVFVTVSGGRPASRRYRSELDIRGQAVDAGDTEQLFHLARAKAADGRRMVIHAAPVEYELDGHRGIRDPLDMYGQRLGGVVNVVSVAPGPMRNLALCVERCHLEVEGLVIAPYASGLATLVDDEREIGVVCVDIGAGTTSIAVFADGKLVYGEVVPVGGHHITSDIARGLSTPLAHAERMKTLFGSALPAIADERERIAVPLVGERGVDTINKIPRSILTGIIQPRLEEIFELVRERIAASGFAAVAGRRVVLTGGTSQMTGARELAATMLGCQVRLGEPIGLSGLPDAHPAACLSAAAGLLKYAASPEASAAIKPGPRPIHSGDSTYLARVGNWLRESF